MKPNHRTVLMLLAIAGCSSSPSPDLEPDAPTLEPDAGGGSACGTAVVAQPGTVLTTTGPVTGAAEGSLYAWRGIPYAAPPTGDLRWRAPQAARCSSEARKMVAFGPACPQLDKDDHVVGNEDCLTLNVWAPAAAASAPVMVFIHGGGNVQGTASDPIYNGTALATQTGAVVVTFDYRLGALGFFASTALDAESDHQVSGNYGILDQIAALQWVQANIAGFGGDPDHVLLFGESAGAQDTLIHVASPLSAGLFAAAAAESGGSYRTTLAEAEASFQPVLARTGCASASSVTTCLRSVNAADLVAIPSALGPLEGGMRYVPVIDGYVQLDTVPNTIGHALHNQVPLLLGTNAAETSRMVPRVSTREDYEAAVRTMYGAAAPALLALYPAADYASPQRALVQVTTDVTWTCPIRRLARAASTHQVPPVFRYYFSWTAPGAGGAAVGATHGLELPFVFGTFAGFSAGFTPSAADLALSATIQGYWSRFAATGDPNGGGAPSWPTYDASIDPMLELDTPISTVAGLATAHCDAIDGIAP